MGIGLRIAAAYERAALWGQIVLHRAVGRTVGTASDHDGSAPVGRLGLEQASKDCG